MFEPNHHPWVDGYSIAAVIPGSAGRLDERLPATIDFLSRSQPH
jgi:hypothetical protein